MIERMHFTQDGHPLNPQSIFIGVQRAHLPPLEHAQISLDTNRLIRIPVKSDGVWENLVGVVRQIRMYRDGFLVLMDCRYQGSMLQSWSAAPLWIPHNGTAGILAFWK